MAEDEALSVRRVGGRLRVVRTEGGVIGATASRANRNLVVDICEQADIPYFVVPEPFGRRFRLGVDEAYWPGFVAALLAAGRQRPFYAGVAARSRRGRKMRWAELTTNPLIARAALEQSQLEVFEIVAPPQGRAFDRPWACLVDKWHLNVDGSIGAPSRNARTTHIGPHHRRTTTIAQADRVVHTLEPFADRHMFDIDFPIDVVYMWVDGDDAQWRERKNSALARRGEPVHEVAAAEERFRDGGELLYSLRSIERFAPWVRRVFLVTDRQVPSWLDAGHSKLTLVDHTEIFGDKGVLPSFNSHAIGARLHHISGLSEHYIHFNDDFFLGREVGPEVFFHSNGTARFFLSRSTLPFNDDPLPHEAARRNVANLLKRDFGRTPTRVFWHTPIVQRRSVLLELEQRYPNEFESTWNSQFRADTDYEVNSWLHHYYGYLTGRAVPSRITYDYFDLSDRLARRRMSVLVRRRDKDTFCINDSPETTDEQRQWAAGWLDRYFPNPSGFELPSFALEHVTVAGADDVFGAAVRDEDESALNAADETDDAADVGEGIEDGDAASSTDFLDEGMAENTAALGAPSGPGSAAGMTGLADG